MLKLLGKKEHKKSDMEHMLILKKNLQMEARKIPSEMYEIEHVKERLEEISQKVAHLHDRIDSLEGKRPEGSEDGVKKSKIKKIVEENLREHGKLTSYDLAQILNLSRTRCSEYLNEMERAGVVRGSTLKKKRYYEMRQQQ
jgi:response regulator of citrate/malate metabolism